MRCNHKQVSSCLQDSLVDVSCPVTIACQAVPPRSSGAGLWHLLILILTVLCPQPGDIQKNPSDDCTFFSCLKIHNQLISSVSNITCPDFNPDDCVPVSGIPLALCSA